MKRIVGLLMLSALALFLPAAAQTIPQSIKIQGYLSDQSGGPAVPANGSYTMGFAIFDALTDGTSLATAGPMAVTVTNGVYEASISASASVFSGSPRYLEITVNGEVLSPRLQFDSTPFAFRSEISVTAESVAPGSVGAAGLADGSVTGSKIGVPCADGQVLVRSGATWTCGALPAAPQVCSDGSYMPCYTGPAGTLDVGHCKAGKSSCKPDRTGFGPCVGEITPVPEVFCPGNGLDDDCDGLTDEGTCPAPTVTTLPVTNQTATSVWLQGAANPNGAATTAWFRYSNLNPGTCNDTFGTRTPGTGGFALGAGTSTVPFNQPTVGLTPGVTYYYCAIASNNGGTSFGSVLSFVAQDTPPTVSTNAANAITSTSASLNGSANPNGGAASGWFRYATTNPSTCDDTFGTRVPASGGTALGAGFSPVQYTQGLTGLTPATTYYYCAIASNSRGTSFGSVVSFTTIADNPTVTTNAASP